MPAEDCESRNQNAVAKSVARTMTNEGSSPPTKIRKLDEISVFHYPAICVNEIIGCRVVRGRDFLELCDQKANGLELKEANSPEESEGYVGTLIDVKQKTAIVMWDDGHKGWYGLDNLDKAGALLVFDDGPTGRVHEGRYCEGCNKKPIWGMAFSCSKCPDCWLCVVCYGKDEHSEEHSFYRYDYPASHGCKGTLLPQRKGSRKIISKGMFDGALVKKSRDFRWGRQCMSEENTGNLIRTEPVYEKSGRSGKLVNWRGTRKYHRYCVGAVGGKVEIKCVSATQGWPYYVDHMPHLLLPKEYLRCSEHVLGDNNDQDEAELIVSGCVGHKKQGGRVLPLEAPGTSGTLDAAETTGLNDEPFEKLVASAVVVNGVNDLMNQIEFAQQFFMDGEANNIHSSERFFLLNFINESFPDTIFGEVDEAINIISWHQAPSPEASDQDRFDGLGSKVDKFLRNLARKTPRPYKKGKGLAALLDWQYDSLKSDLPKPIWSDKDRYSCYRAYLREGVEADREVLKDLFQRLTGHDIMVYSNLKKRQNVLEAISTVAYEAKEIGAAYVVLVVSGHGFKDATSSNLIITDHMETVCLYRDMIHHLKLDIPIVCFLQACQTEVAICKRNFFTFSETHEEVQVTQNFFVVKAGVPMQGVWHNHKKGSYFIQAMPKFLKKGGILFAQLKEMNTYLKQLLLDRNLSQQGVCLEVPCDFPHETFEF